MKKIVVLLPVVFAVLIIFACTLPTYIEIKGTPEVTFPSVSDFGEKFAEIMREKISTGNLADSDSDINDQFKILECPDVESKIMTFSIYRSIIGSGQDDYLNSALRDLWNNSIPLGTPEELIPDSITLPVGDIPLLDNMSDKYPVSIGMEKFKEFTEGFTFSMLESGVFSDGTAIIDHLVVKIYLVDDDGNTLTTTIMNEKTGLSGFDTEGWETCPWNEIPDHGDEIDGVDDKMNALEDINLRYEVFLKGGTEFEKAWIGNSQIRSELIIWFPFAFIAGPDGANFNIPDIFVSEEDKDNDKKKDIFGREEDKTDDLTNELVESITSLELVITMNVNPFKNGTMYVESWKDSTLQVGMRFDLGEYTFNMKFTDDNLKAINETIPFIPEIRVHFDPGEELVIPHVFKTTEFFFKARIDYKKKISDLGV
jgi:hypothetical protein